LDEVQVYNYALSPAQVAWNFNQGKPVGYWKLNECQGNTAYDSGTGGNNGTISIGSTGDNQTAGTCSSGTGTEAWNNGTTGKRNASLDFDGTDDYITVNSSSTTDITAKPFTIAAWFKTSKDGVGTIIRGGASSTDDYPALVVDWTSLDGSLNDTLTFGYKGSTCNLWTTYIDTTTTVNDGNWHFGTGVYDGTEMILYLNGREENRTTPSSVCDLNSTNSDISMGRYSGGSEYIDGQIDEVKIFNYSMTLEQIQTLYNEGAVRFNE
jgi:hypothetical protein